MSHATRDTESDSAATVLIVEDEADVADLYEMWLADQYSVRIAHSGSEALNQLDETVDVVLLDRRMPGISGDEVLAKIRSQRIDCRVAIVSAVTPDFDVIEMGFDEYLTKPVEKDEVLDAIDRMIRRSTYDSAIQEYYQLVATETALRESKTESELRGNEEFQQLRANRETMEQNVDRVIDDFGQEDFEAAFRDFG